MGLLDDLEEEANKRRESEEEVLKRKRELFNQTTVPAMENLYGYLQRLAKTLNFLKSERRAVYHIAGYGDVVCKIASDMNVQAQMPMFSRDIRLTVTGIIDEAACPVVKIDGTGRIEAMIEAAKAIQPALDDFNRAIALKPGHLTALTQRGHANVRAHRWAEAIA